MASRPPARTPVNRGVLAFGVAVPVLALVAVVASVLGGDGEASTSSSTTVVAAGSTTETSGAVERRVDEEWNAGLEAAVEPLEEALPSLSDGVTAWGAGDLDDAELVEILDRVEPLVDDVGTGLEELGAHPDDELAGPLLADMAALYGYAIDTHRAAVAASTDDLATQYDRLGRRLRVLADRVFDRARERTAAPFDPGEGVDLRRPAEVPNWPRLGLGVGPPLEPEDRNVDELPLERQDDRASQPADAWVELVESLDLPAPAEVRAAVEDGSRATLGEHGRRLVAAAESLRDEPVPDGDRARADRLALGWLLRADGARAAQLAAVDGTGFGTRVATALVSMSAGRAYAVG